ncbi:hypothetical protein [Streptomyces sp. SID8352]|uniref:hypothetical protein n=1 Tax=Streptomyces sp. SID8352 TaxID=2690338 RepID=UPI001F3AFF70|nr:hypothetical protein [Streptomyces sp. SID8352]
MSGSLRIDLREVALALVICPASTSDQGSLLATVSPISISPEWQPVKASGDPYIAKEQHLGVRTLKPSEMKVVRVPVGKILQLADGVGI